VSRALAASGVAHDRDRLRWPLGLKILGGPQIGHEGDELREQLDALFQVAAEQTVQGSADPKILQEITRAVNRLRDLLTQDRRERDRLPEAVYDEAERFLNQLVHSEAVLEESVRTEGADAR
jgi:hypothetical protein